MIAQAGFFSLSLQEWLSTDWKLKLSNKAKVHCVGRASIFDTFPFWCKARILNLIYEELTCEVTVCSQWLVSWPEGWSRAGNGRHDESSPAQTAACSPPDCDLHTTKHTHMINKVCVLIILFKHTVMGWVAVWHICCIPYVYLMGVYSLPSRVCSVRLGRLQYR